MSAERKGSGSKAGQPGVQDWAEEEKGLLAPTHVPRLAIEQPHKAHKQQQHQAGPLSEAAAGPAELCLLSGNR